jgi:hypothetical protein
MKKITPAAWRELVFPTPIDLERDGPDKHKNDENDDWPPALQNIRTVEAAVSAANGWQPDLQFVADQRIKRFLKFFEMLGPQILR